MKKTLINTVIALSFPFALFSSNAHAATLVATQNWTSSSCGWATNWAGNGVSSKNLVCSGSTVANKLQTPTGCLINHYFPSTQFPQSIWSSPCSFSIYKK